MGIDHSLARIQNQYFYIIKFQFLNFGYASSHNTQVQQL
uniref:Uncharacterized protein n=1 Tax=Anguilla anguilla TaxID=7936 RepID=A0A0E9RZQ4_ANGAN